MARNRAYEDEEYEDERSRKRSRRGFCCPFCQAEGPPVSKKKTSTVGLVLSFVLAGFCLLLGFFLCFPVFFAPFCFLFLLIQEEQRYCVECGSNLG